MDETERRKMAADVYLKEYEKLRNEVESNLAAEGTLLNFATILFSALAALLWTVSTKPETASTGSGTPFPGPEMHYVEPYLLAFAPIIFAGLWVALLHKQGNSTFIAHYVGTYLRRQLRNLGVQRPLEWDFWKHAIARETAAKRGWFAHFAGKWVSAYGGRLLVMVVAPFGLCIARFATMETADRPWGVAVTCWAFAGACVGLSIWYRNVTHDTARLHIQSIKKVEDLE